MATVFRLHNGNNNLTDWSNSSVYGTNVIDQIQDPDGANASKEITSIPSPFARIDLIKTAFKEVIAQNSLEGVSIYHKMVSDTLDVAEIFFNFEKLRDKVNIIKWDKKIALEQLKGNPSQIADTLETFLESDAKTYHFDKMDCMYILCYKGNDRKSQYDVIGATSPATLFFSSANDLSYIHDIQFGQDKPFDQEYCPLYKRDFEFVKYLFAFKKAYRDFSDVLPEVFKYLELTYQKLNQEQKAQVDAVSDLNSYEILKFNQTEEVEILNGLPFHTRPEIQPQSDFEIDSNLYQGSHKPLVLPIKSGSVYANLHYVSAPWGNVAQAPCYDNHQVKDRLLPQDGTKYPYLTISDFLEDYLIEMPEETNSEVFFDGNVCLGKNKCKYLIPVKPLYFECFDVKQLQGEVSKGAKTLEIKYTAGGSIEVVLRIPIKGKDNVHFVEFTRLYSANTIADPVSNKGGIKKFEDVEFGIFPNVSFSTDADAYYRLGLVYDENSDNFDLDCYKGATPLTAQNVKCVVRNENCDNLPKCKTYVIEGHRIDYIQFTCTTDRAQGLIIPKLPSVQGADQYRFAIDLGTSNTHIEYSVNGERHSNSFEITDEDSQLVKMSSKMASRLGYIYDADFCPSLIGDKNEFKFPIRTILSAGSNTNWKQSVSPIGHGNVAFTYCKRQTYKYNKNYTDLKWSNDSDAEKQLTCYIESIMLLLRNKVVLNHGLLPKTQILWFYPISMSEGKKNLLAGIWKNAYEKYFRGDAEQNVLDMTESVAPYEYYKNLHGSADIVTVDIGGGTTDVVISQRGEVKYITSFRFATNTLFSNYLNSQNGEMNGIIRYFKDVVQEILNQNNLSGLPGILSNLSESKKVTEMASFFFSLKENKQVIDAGISQDVDFIQMLTKDDKLKIVFILFYAAIIYHVASIMKNKNCDMPRYITFSGNGSKVVSVLTSNESILSNYTKLIFEKVYDKKYNQDGLNVVFKVEQPKEATCKGGILCDISQLRAYNQSVSSSKVILKGYDNSSFVEDETYDKIDGIYEEHVVNQVLRFFGVFFELNEEFNYYDNFVSDKGSLSSAKQEYERDLSRYVHDMLELRKQEVGHDQPVEETLFFYAITGVINHLANIICTKNGK